jgi:hypothetical protein
MYQSETIGKAEAHKQSEAIVHAEHTNNEVSCSELPLYEYIDCGSC